MAFILRSGTEAQGEGVSTDDLPRIKVLYAEAGFDCVSFVLPTGDLRASVKAAMEHGMNEASKQLGLPRKHLHALASAPLVKPDGSPVPVEEWANNHFIVVKVQQDKKEEGLLGKFRKQHAFLEQVMRKGMEGLDVSTSKKAVDDVPNIQEELRMLKEENAYLRATIFALKEQFTAEMAAADAEITLLKAQNIALREEVTLLKAENEKLKAELEMVQKRMAQLSGMDLVMVRKMLEECRSKCRTLLLQRNIHMPYDWNKLIRDPICVDVLKDAGLTNGLLATAYGKKSQQTKGSEAAHTIMETPEVYATIVCKMTGHLRDQMLNVFEFVFGSKAEDLAFEELF